MVVVIDGVDLFVGILGAVWTVGRYVGRTSLVCIGQIHVGKQVFWACLYNPCARPNDDPIIFAAHKFGEEWPVVDWYLFILGGGKGLKYVVVDGLLVW